MGRVYALANQKGGVGKTTTAVNLGAYLAQAGKHVLLVDVDPQANATSSLGVDKNALSRSIYDALIGAESLSGLVRLTGVVGLDLVPSSPALAGAEVEMVDMPGRESRLRQALDTVRHRYDYVLIDTPPSLGMLTVNALTASDGVLIPIQCEYLPLEGLTQLLHTIELVRQGLNPDLVVRGLILTMYDSRTNLARQVVEEIQQHFPSTVFRSIIPRSVKLSEAPSYGEPIASYAPESSGGLAYASLCEEIMNGESYEGDV
ncbi:MAG TPA: ParA family protein [Chloroflexi bacterium]|jgi:chromosome partitioning protein|nr:ParA family protein [Chloroflexota bacterium]